MSAPLAYTPYQSHRRGASSASIGAAGVAQGQTQVPGQTHTSTVNQTPSTSSSSSPASVAFARQAPQNDDSLAHRPVVPSSHGTRTGQTQNGTTRNNVEASQGQRNTVSSMAPPPLRSASSLRTAHVAGASRATAPAQHSPSSVKGKGNADQHGRAVSSKVTSPTRKTVSSSLTVPTSAPQPSTVAALKAEAAESESQSKRNSLTPSPASSSHGHSRSLSNSALPANLPHIISTAQRLRTASPMGNSSPPTSSPSYTPTASSPTMDASFGNAALPNSISTLAGPSWAAYGEGVGRGTAYRPGFQPKGSYRVRTDEFVAARRRRRDRTGQRKEGESGTGATNGRTELESERLERRLEKLIALHYDESPIFTEEEALGLAPSWLPGTIRRARLQAEADRRLREEEVRIVKWEDDKARKTCSICSTPFSLTIRKHHCRTCGRVVCASPHLSVQPGVVGSPLRRSDMGEKESVDESVKCSGLMVSDGKGGTKVKEVPRWDEAVIGGGGVDQEGRTRGIRVCRDCKETILHRQYMLDDGDVPVYMKLYESLRSLQKDIEQSLPEFQEMILGLQKHDAAAALGTSLDENASRDPLLAPSNDAQSLSAIKAKNRTALALQRDAAQARKQLLANFANYDLIARKIRDLDDEGNKSLARLKVGVHAQANVFLQANMFPLQNLPKLSSSTPKGSVKPLRSNGESTPPRKQGSAATPTAGDKAGVDSQADVRESLAVLEQQLGLVRQYASSASKSRKLQDASSLNASARELEGEITRLRALLQ